MREGDEVRIGSADGPFGEVIETERDQVSVKILGAGIVNAGASIKIPGNRYDKVPILQNSDRDLIKNVACA